MNVGEVWRLALPPGSRLVAGEAGLGEQVNWATTFRSRAPGLEHLDPGEIVLLALSTVRVVDASLTLARIVTLLHERAVSAIAVDGEIDESSMGLAQQYGVPLFALPAAADLHGLERSIVRLLANKQAELQTRSAQLQRQLTQVAMQGKGLPGIAAELGRITGKSVAFYDVQLQPLAESGSSAPLSPAQAKALQVVARNPVSLSQEPSAEWIEADGEAMPRWAAPIPVNNRAAGAVTLAAPDTQLTELDGLLVVRAAAVCAVEMVKQRAVVEAEAKMQGDFVRDLLRGSYVSEASILARAANLEWDVEAVHAVAAFDLKSPADGAGGVLRSAISRRGVRPLVAAWERSAAFVYPLPGDARLEDWREVVEQIRVETGGQMNVRGLSAGVGRPHSGLKGVQRSFTEAEQALHAGERLFGSGQTVAFADLGAYRVLAQLHGTAELQSFEQEVLGDLIEYDRKSGGQLLPTLEAFFTANGNLSKTAEMLFVHRNTLMYRLNRVEELTSRSLDDPETRFDLQLALKMHHVAPRGRA